MPRSFGGGRGVSSSACSSSNSTKDAATLIGLSRSSKNMECNPITDSGSCQMAFDHYEECVSKYAPLYGPDHNCCNEYLKMMAMASCPEVNKDPGRRRSQTVKELEEELQRTAIKQGFSGWREYRAHRDERNPAMSRIACERYYECLSNNKTHCDFYRNKCPKFQQAPKCNAAVDTTP